MNSNSNQNEKASPPDPATPGDFLNLYGDALYGFAMVRVQNAALAEDLVQETLFKAIKNYEKFRGDSSVKTWLTSILRNEIANHFRSAKERMYKNAGDFEAVSMSDLLHPSVSNEEFKNSVEQDEFWSMIKQCFSKVPDHLLQVFLSKFGEDVKTTEEICSEMDITASNFSVRMFRTRLLLRKCVEDNWIES